jgi:GT2 family glycosyltransferase
MKTAVIISSAARPQVLHETVTALRRQTVLPLAIIVSLCDAASVSPETAALPEVRLVEGEKGLTKQRNTGLHATPSAAEYVLFLDDDAELAPNYLESMENLFDTQADIAAASAHIVIDGLQTGYLLTRKEAIAAIAKHPLEQGIEPAEGISGCNIFVRRSIAEAVQFDERLPLSGWLEDFDFSIRCRPHGAVVWNLGTRVAHLGMQRAGRERGFLVGYAHIANAYYLWQKGVIPSFGRLLGGFWLPAVGRTFVGLLRRTFSRNDVWRLRFDHAGRLAGNAMALLDAARHRLRPERLLDFL